MSVDLLLQDPYVVAGFREDTRGPFEERPLTVREFLRHPDYGNQVSAWPAVVDELEAIFGDDPTRFRCQEAILCWAIGGGKSWLVSRADAYMLYWLHNLRDPQGFLGLAAGSPVMLLNQSINEEQARRVVFDEIATAIDQMPWFRRKGYLPDPKIRSELRFTRKGILVFPGTSKVTNPAGYHLFAGVIDEAAFFEQIAIEQGSRVKAEEIYYSMRRRIRSRMGGRGMLLMISSPRHTDDFIEQMHQFALYGDPERNIEAPDRTYTSRKAIWETKPGPEKNDDGTWQQWVMVPWQEKRARGDGSIEVVSEMLVPERDLADFQADPERAKREHAAVASRIGLGYFWDPDIVWRKREFPGLPGYSPDRTHPFTTVDGVPRLLPEFGWRRPAHDSTAHHMHIDLALSRDKVGISLAHVDGTTIIRGTVLPTIWLDLMVELRPPTVGQIDLGQIRDFVFDLKRRGFPIRYITMDQYQSADSIQQFQKAGIEAAVLSVDADTIAYDTMKECFAAGTLVACLDGVDRPIEALVEPTWVYAWNGYDLVPALASAANLTRRGAGVLRLTLDNGESVVATPDHLFLRRDGTFARLDSLQPGDSLMPLYRRVTKGRFGGYEQIRSLWTGQWMFTHRWVAQNVVDQSLRFRPDDVVHHRDTNKRNNLPWNLEPMIPSDHARTIDGSKGLERAWESMKDPKKRANRDRAARETISRLWTGDRTRMIEGMNRAWADPDRRKRHGEAMRRAWKDGKFANRGRSNHLVASIVTDQPCDVYDIEVPGAHCFALSAGVLVHNCIVEGRLDYYQYRPFWDCIKSLIVPRAGKVDHTPNGKKDVSDAVAATCRTLTERWAQAVTPAAVGIPNPAVAAVIGSRTIGGRREGPY